jgi:hypothetical protein
MDLIWSQPLKPSPQGGADDIFRSIM